MVLLKIKIKILKIGITIMFYKHLEYKKLVFDLQLLRT